MKLGIELSRHVSDGVARAADSQGRQGGETIAESYTLVYDGDCGFCQRQVDLIRRWDRGDLIEAVPFQTADLERLGLSRGAVEEAMHLVSPIGRTWRGAAAARELLALLPGGRPLTWLFSLPGAMHVAERIYRWIARRRHRFGCGSDLCRRGASGADSAENP